MPKLLNVATLLAVAITMAACFKKPQFSEFSPFASNLTVSMPRPVKHQTREADIGGQNIIAHAYSSTFDEVTYVLTFMTIPGETGKNKRVPPSEVLLDSLQVQLIRATGARIIKQKSVSLPSPTHSHSGREVSLMMPGGKQTMIARLFPSDDPYVQLVVTLPSKPSYNQNLYAMRFLDSARIKQ